MNDVFLVPPCRKPCYPGCGGGANAILDGCSRSLKFGFRFHSPSLWAMLAVQILTKVFRFSSTKSFEPEPKLSDVGAEVTDLRCLELESEPQP